MEPMKQKNLGGIFLSQIVSYWSEILTDWKQLCHLKSVKFCEIHFGNIFAKLLIWFREILPPSKIVIHSLLQFCLILPSLEMRNFTKSWGTFIYFRVSRNKKTLFSWPPKARLPSIGQFFSRVESHMKSYENFLFSYDFIWLSTEELTSEALFLDVSMECHDPQTGV